MISICSCNYSVKFYFINVGTKISRYQNLHFDMNLQVNNFSITQRGNTLNDFEINCDPYITYADILQADIKIHFLNYNNIFHIQLHHLHIHISVFIFMYKYIK